MPRKHQFPTAGEHLGLVGEVFQSHLSTLAMVPSCCDE